LIIGC